MPNDDEARLWVEYQGGYRKLAFKNVQPSWNQEEALRETLLSPASKWMGKGRLANTLTSRATTAETMTGEEESKRAAAFPRSNSAGGASSSRAGAAFDVAAEGEPCLPPGGLQRPGTRESALDSTGGSSDRGERGRMTSPLTGNSKSLLSYSHPRRPPELFATTVSLLNSAISLPPSREASLNPGEFELQSRPSSSGFFLPVSSGVNNPAAQSYRDHAASSARRAIAKILVPKETNAAALATGGDKKNRRKTSRVLRLALTLAGGKERAARQMEAEVSKVAGGRRTDLKQAHQSTQLMDPLGVTVAMDKFDREDTSFGVKAGDLVVSPLGRIVEMAGVGLMHRAAMAPNGLIHMSAPVPVPFIDFKTKCGWSRRRTTRADLVGFRRGYGLAPMESEERMDEFTLNRDQSRQSMPTGTKGKETNHEDEDEDKDEDDQVVDDAARDGWLADGSSGTVESVDASESYRPRYVLAPEHVGIAQRASEMLALREDRVRRCREVEAESQWRAARGKPTLSESNRLAEWADRVRDVHEAQVLGSDPFQRGYLTPKDGIAPGPKPVVTASATRTFSGMRPLNEILPRPALDTSQAHWSLNRPAARGEYTPMGSANRLSLI